MNDGRLIRLSLPELTVERRAELVKVLHQKLESARISVRKVREEVREMAGAEEKTAPSARMKNTVCRKIWKKWLKSLMIK